MNRKEFETKRERDIDRETENFEAEIKEERNMEYYKEDRLGIDDYVDENIDDLKEEFLNTYEKEFHKFCKEEYREYLDILNTKHN